MLLAGEPTGRQVCEGRRTGRVGGWAAITPRWASTVTSRYGDTLSSTSFTHNRDMCKIYQIRFYVKQYRIWYSHICAEKGR